MLASAARTTPMLAAWDSANVSKQGESALRRGNLASMTTGDQGCSDSTERRPLVNETPLVLPRSEPNQVSWSHHFPDFGHSSGSRRTGAGPTHTHPSTRTRNARNGQCNYDMNKDAHGRAAGQDGRRAFHNSIGRFRLFIPFAGTRRGYTHTHAHTTGITAFVALALAVSPQPSRPHPRCIAHRGVEASEVGQRTQQWK